MSIKLMFTLICDDARIEQSNKLIIIGLYNYVLAIRRPQPLNSASGPQDRFAMSQLCFVKRYEIDDSAPHRVETFLTEPDGRRLRLGDGLIAPVSSDPYVQQIVIMQGPILAVGKYRISATY